MALRLAGEEYSVVQGLDSQGWLRTVTANDALAGVTVDQQGSGRLAEFRGNGAAKAYINNAGSLVLLTANALLRDVDTAGLQVYGGSTTGASSFIALTGKDGSPAPDGIRLFTTNAAKTATVERIRFPGNADAGSGPVIVYEPLDAREVIKNTGASNGGAVAVDDVLALLNNFMEWDEMADPSAPAANKTRLYCRDNGSGKTQICALFPTGATQVLATEP